MRSSYCSLPSGYGTANRLNSRAECLWPFMPFSLGVKTNPSQSMSLLTPGSDGKNGRAAPAPPQRLSASAPWWPAASGRVQLEPAATGGPEWQNRPCGWIGGHPLWRCLHSRPRTRVYAPAGAADAPRQATALGHPSGVWGATQRSTTRNLPLCTVSLEQQAHIQCSL